MGCHASHHQGESHDQSFHPLLLGVRFCIRWYRRVLTTPSMVAQHTFLLEVRTLKNIPKMGFQKKLGAPCLSARCANGGPVSKKRGFLVREKSNITLVCSPFYFVLTRISGLNWKPWRRTSCAALMAR